MTSFAFFELTPASILVLLVLGLVLFGRKLPEMGKFLGKGIVEFKKGMRGMEDDIDSGYSAPRHDPAALDASIRKVMKLPDETQLLPGHCSPTTLGDERRTNLYVRRAIGG